MKAKIKVRKKKKWFISIIRSMNEKRGITKVNLRNFTYKELLKVK